MSNHEQDPNPGLPYNPELFINAQCNKAAILRRAANLTASRLVKGDYQIAWLLRAITNIDLTTLAGDDTPGNVQRLCAKAKNPIRSDLVQALDIKELNITTGAVCVYPVHVADAVAALKGSGIPVAAVATGFPAGKTDLKTRLEEITFAVEAGAAEIDVVISRQLVLLGKWEELYNELVQMKKACGQAHLKVILAVGELPTYRDIYKASMIAMCAGAAFIKTSTGKETLNAHLAAGIVMVRAIRDYYNLTQIRIGFKPAGGISTAKDAITWLALMYEELGEEWTHNTLFRIGASSLLGDIERQIQHGVTGKYAAKHYLPMA